MHFASFVQQVIKAYAAPSMLLKADAPLFTIEIVNDALLEVSQRTSEQELLGKSLFEAFPDNPNDLQADGVTNLKTSLLNAIQTGVAQEMPIQKYDIAVPNSDQFETRYWQVKNTPIFDESGKVVYIVHTTEDITEKILLEQKAHELEILVAQKKIILENTQSTQEIGSWSLDLETNTFFWSPELFKICGYANEAFAPSINKALEIIHPDDIEKVSHAYKNTIEEGHPWHIEFRIIKPDGIVILVLVTGVAIKNSHGKAVKLTGLLQNITSSRQLETMLRQTVNNLIASEKRYRRLFENNPSPMYIWDFKTLQIVDCNEEALVLYGYTKEEFLNLTLKDIRPKEDIHLIDELTKSEESYSRVHKKVWRHKKKNGEIIFVNIVGHLFDNNGKKMSLVALNDVTEKIKAEEALKESETRYKSFFNNSLDGNLLSIENGRILAANPVACKMLGYTEAELCKLSRKDIADTTDKRLIKLLNDKELTGHGEAIHRFYRKDKTVFEAYVSSTVYSDVNGEKRNAVIIKDIDEKLKAEQALRENEAKYRSLFNNNIDATILATPDGKINAANPAACKMFQYTEEEICLGGREKIIDTSDPRFLELLAERQAKGSAQVNLRCKRKSGEYFETETSSIIYKDASGQKQNIVTIRDITDKLKAEKALIESDKKYRLLFYKSPIPKWIYDTSTLKILDVNEVAIEHYGYSREEFLNLHLEDLRPQEEIPKLHLAFEKQQTQDKLYKAGIFIHKKKNGQLISVEISSIPIEYEGKKCKLIIANDVTDIEYALKELALSIERYNYVTKATSDAIWDWDLTNSKAIWGEGFESIFGYSISNIASDISFLVDNIHPEDKQRIQDEFYKILKSDVKQWQEEYRFKKADGSYAYVINKVFVIRDNNHRTIRIVGGMRDITTRKKEVLRLKLLESVITNSNDGVIITEAIKASENEGRKIVYVNEAFTKITGYNASEIIGQSTHFLIGEKTDKAELEKIKIRIRNWEALKTDIINYKKNGEPFWNNLSISPVLDDNESYSNWVAIIRDVTEQKQHVTEMIKAIIKTQEDERFEIGSELHDNICQILATCKIAFKMLEKNIANSDKVWFEQGIDQINLVFKEIRNLSHRLAPTFFKDGSLEESLKSLVRTFNIEEQYEISLALDNDFKSHLTSREFQLNFYRILQEQLRNIIKYAEAKRIDIIGKSTSSSLQLIIKDDGVGFNPDTIKSGIGLANMRRRAELFGGKLYIDAAIGKGCCITVDIPLTEIS